MNMSLGSPGVQPNRETKCKLKLKKCNLCQKVEDNPVDKNLTSIKNGKKTLMQCSKVLNDGLWSGITYYPRGVFLMLHILM